MLQYEHSDKIFVDATEALQKMDWEFDIDGTDDARVSAGFKHLVKIRRLLKTINKSNTILSTPIVATILSLCTTWYPARISLLQKNLTYRRTINANYYKCR